ncbi:MAG TPA: formate dehydrogenase accessory sulfurtransferase FdhD [Acetobacteraceae bacterium]|nr:formate dehydrogenase accessory sulfurtransferase FdhD [Acetobacteraceae bacterium]
MPSASADSLAEEVPIAVSYAGIAHAVMMGTPADLDDFAVGFSITEGIAEAEDIRSIETTRSGDTISLDVTLAPDRLRRFLAVHRTRNLRGHTSCGICGVRDLDGIPGIRNRAGSGRAPPPEAIRRALADLRAFQPLAQRTHATHAAAWVDSDGGIRLVREDVGRHIALDKLIGALARGGDRADGFCLVSSRCSYEMVQKAVAAGFPALVALSAPTTLAVRTAAEAGLWLCADAARTARA